VTWLRMIASRIRNVHEATPRCELNEELQSHLEMLTEKTSNVGCRLSKRTARQKSPLAVHEQVREAVRDQRGFPPLESLLADVRFGLRMVRKNPGIHGSCLFSLWLSASARNTAILLLPTRRCWRRCPILSPKRLVNVWSKFQGNRAWVSPGDFTDWKRQSATFQDLDIWNPDNFKHYHAGKARILLME